jgi:DNA-binding response OmpR family regulator
MKPRILVAEDDEHIRAGLVDALEGQGYAVEAAADGRKALDAYRRERVDLVLLDLMMPALSGYDVCRAIRQKDAATPILMLTAKGEEIDKVVGLELGADDYITKPFGVRELLARVAAALRRSRAADTPSGAAHVPDEFRFGPAVVNRRTYTCTLGKRRHDLTARELKLLEAFYLRPGDVLSRNDLLNAVWGVDYYGTTRTLDQHVAQVRRKVEPRPDAPVTILTVHGVGYRYAPSPTAR